MGVLRSSPQSQQQPISLYLAWINQADLRELPAIPKSALAVAYFWHNIRQGGLPGTILIDYGKLYLELAGAGSAGSFKPVGPILLAGIAWSGATQLIPATVTSFCPRFANLRRQT